MKRLVVRAILCGLALAPAARGQTGSYLGKTYFQWAAGLSSKDAAVRRSSAFALGKMGDGARPAVLQILGLLEKDPDAGVREAAAAAVGDICMDLRAGINRVLPAEALQAVQKALEKDADPRVRRSAAYAVGSFGPNAAPAVEALTRALKSSDAPVRQNAAWALGQVGGRAGEAALEGLCEVLGDTDPLVRRDAAAALGSLEKSKAVGPLLGLVKGERDDVVLKTALDALAHLAGEENRETNTEALEARLKDPDEETQRGAAFVLARIGGAKAVPAVPVLRKALKDEDPQVQGLAAAGLAGAGKEAEPAVPDLAEALRESKDLFVRRNSALALGHVGPGAKPAVLALVEVLRGKEPLELRQHAAEALALIALPHTEEAVPALLEAIQNDPDPLVRQRCVWALFQYRALEGQAQRKLLEKARPILSEVLAEKAEAQTLVRYDAARMLANSFASDAPDRTVDVLLEMLGNKTLRVFNTTDATVVGTGSEATRGTAQVQPNYGGDARYMAAEALAWLGAKASKRKDVVEALKAAANDPDAELKKMAKKALEVLGVR
jgi:HEAT repeat protein